VCLFPLVLVPRDILNDRMKRKFLPRSNSRLPFYLHLMPATAFAASSLFGIGWSEGNAHARLLWGKSSFAQYCVEGSVEMIVPMADSLFSLASVPV
jgi:hypothetical protein